MNLKLKPILVNQKFVKNAKSKSKTKEEPEVFKIEITMPGKTAIISGVPASISLGMILSPFDINDEEFDISVNGFSVRNINFDNPLGSFGCPGDEKICIVVSEKEDIDDTEELCEVTIDELLEENSLIILENETLKDDIARLTSELEKANKIKDSLIDAIVKASTVLATPMYEEYINPGESK